MLDLQGYSVERGEQSTSSRVPLQLGHRVKHLVVYLPIGSKEGGYDLALLNETAGVLWHATGIARVENHIVVLRVEVNIAGVPPGTYFLGLREAGVAWTRFPVHVF